MALPRHTDRSAEAREVLRRCIHALMGANRVTQTALASYLRMGQPELSKRLKGKHPFTEDHLALIADYFGVEVSDLYHPETVLLRSRCFSLVPEVGGQLELCFLPEPALAAVS